jgi:hypothetical protein
MQILTVIYHGIYIVIFHVIYGSFLKLQTASGKLQEASDSCPEASGGCRRLPRSFRRLPSSNSGGYPEALGSVRKLP